MKKIVFDIHSNHELWSLIDKKFNHILIHKFMPNSAIEWWKTHIKIKNDLYENLSVRNMEFDMMTDLDGLKKIIDLNSLHLHIYQFDKPISNTLFIEYLPHNNLEKILLLNGLKHSYICEYEFLTVSSFDENFIRNIEENELFSSRIKKFKTDD